MVQGAEERRLQNKRRGAREEEIPSDRETHRRHGQLDGDRRGG